MTLRVALAAAAGFCLAFSLPPWGWWPLTFVGAAGLDIVVGSEPSVRRRAGLGFVCGLVWMLMGMWWMWFLTAPGYIVAACIFAGFHAVAAAVSPPGRCQLLGRPAAHTLVEAVRMVFPFGGVPLASLGIAQAGGPLLMVARVGGVLAITWVVFQVGSIVGAAARQRYGQVSDGVQPRPALLIAAIAGVAALCVTSVFAPAGHDDGSPITVAVVQGGGRQGTTAQQVPARQVLDVHLTATRTIRSGEGLDLVVWPENGVDVDRMAFRDSDAYALIAAEAARLNTPFAVGVTLDSEHSNHPVPGRFVNAQLVIAPDGTVGRSYEKVRIVPFGEYVPFRSVFEALGAPIEQIGLDAVPGQDPAVISSPDGTQLGVVISWEVFFGRRARAAAGGDVLLNPTNGSSYTGTVLQTQQVASSRLRAVETGRWVVQSSPTGFSGFISPDGTVVQRTDISQQAVIVQRVTPRSGHTWYTRAGDAPWVVLLAVVFVLAHRAGRRDDQMGPSVTPRSSG